MLCTSFCLSIRYDEKSVFFSLKIGWRKGLKNGEVQRAGF
jgi:hypothetical protein